MPSARWTCLNVVLFSDRVPPEDMRLIGEAEAVDWDVWRRRAR